MADEETGKNPDRRETEAPEGDGQKGESVILHKAWTPGGDLELTPGTRPRQETGSPPPATDPPPGGSEGGTPEGSDDKGSKEKSGG